jgi:hypothetical protein
MRAIYLAQDWDMWRALVNTEIDVWVQWGNFFE